MSYLLKFNMDGLTEKEVVEVGKKLDLIKDHVYPDLVVEGGCCHRGNNVCINQCVSDVGVALELFRLLCNVSVHKSSDDYYGVGVDSRLTVGLEYFQDFVLD